MAPTYAVPDLFINLKPKKYIEVDEWIVNEIAGTRYVDNLTRSPVAPTFSVYLQ